MKEHVLALSLSAALGGLGGAPACAGVIQGTGATPTSTRLGATDAVAFQVAESGPGHALVVPYFTAQNGQMTVLHYVNTDMRNGKAVKLRYRGAGNADTLLDFTLLLSPGDVWTGIVHQGADGRAQLVTTDNSCTYPHIAQGLAQPFSTARLDPASSHAALAANTREGYVEAIVTADIPSPQVYGAAMFMYSPLYKAIKQVNGAALCTLAAFDAAMLNDTSDEAVAAGRGFATPTGGLVGSWYIIDVPGSTTFSGAAAAIQAVNASGQPARGNFVLFPQTDGAVTAPERYTADPLLVSAGLASREKDVNGDTARPTEAAVLTARFSDLPDLSTPYYLPAGALNARSTAGDLTRLLAATSLSNQYATDPSISALTDWVISMPTKRYSVAVDYSIDPSKANASVFSVIPGGIGNAQHFFGGETMPAGGGPNSTRSLSSYGGRQACANPGIWQSGPEKFFSTDREADLHQYGSGAPFYMPNPDTVPLCGAVSVVTFTQGSYNVSALNASLTQRTLTRNFFTNGWAKFGLASAKAPAGLPVIGAAFTKLTNPEAKPGVLGNYGITWPHILDK